MDRLDQSGSSAQAETGSPPAKEPKMRIVNKGLEAIREITNVPKTSKEYFFEKVTQAREEPWRETADQILINDSEVKWRRYMRALAGAPEWLDVGLAHRMRYESLSNNFRAGGDPDISGGTTRTRLRIGVDWKMFRLFTEGQNSSSLDEGGGATGTINSSLFSQDRLLQAFVAVRLDNVLSTGLRTDLHLGRMTLDFGNRRLIARNEFRNTTNSFEGAHWNLAQEQVWRVRAFLVKPVSDTFGVLQASSDTVFWGAQYEDRREPWLQTDLYYFGINSTATASSNKRTFGTYGLRVFRTPAIGQIDYESETAFQVGTVGGGDLFAYFQHAELGYMFPLPWRPHLRFQYDYASGTSNPSGSTSHTFDTLFGEPVRASEKQLTQFHMDIAASIQHVLNEVLIKLSRSIAAETGLRNLCLAGGVALNCVANGKILRDGHFDNIWIQPAAGDAGGALGAALAAYHQFKGGKRVVSPHGDAMQGRYLGPDFAQPDIEQRLKSAGAVFHSLSETDVHEACAKALADEKAVGWFQGRMEFGPRALGGRSILGDARSPSMQSVLNLKVKYRESFRPFAPSVLREDVGDWFAHRTDSPYMLIVADVLENKRRQMTEAELQLFGIEKLNVPRSEIPAVTHVDYSARIQTVHRETNPRYYDLIARFKRLTGCPVIVNTSFNVRGEPIVCTPEDAFRCFMGSEIEVLAVGNCLLLKEEQDPSLKINYKEGFDLD